MKRRSVFADKLKAFDFAFGDDAATSHRGTWRSFFMSRQARLDAPPTALSASDLRPLRYPLILELGCFDAAFLLRIAARHPDTCFIGLDWKARPLLLGAEQIMEEGVLNLALLRARAQDLNLMFDRSELDEIWLFQPEPCDRENERQNRLMSETFLEDVSGVLRSGGSLILKTDHAEYFRWTLDLANTPAATDRFDIVSVSSDFWNDPAAMKHVSQKGFAGESTCYERRFIRRKQPIHYLELRRRQ